MGVYNYVLRGWGKDGARLFSKCTVVGQEATDTIWEILFRY